jgi:predicted nuclease with TOPRIM domain
MTQSTPVILLEQLTQYNTELNTKVTLLENEASCLRAEVDRLTESLRASNERLTAAENELSRTDMIRRRNDNALELLRRNPR